MTQIPDYIERRIRQPIPAGLCVIPGTTPVIAFGDAQTAKVATLGLNPSNREFQGKDGRELTGSCRRLATHRSLCIDDLEKAPKATIAQVLKECNSYFDCKPYDWFKDLELVLNACDVSYYDGFACHLDLVQWATQTKWTCLSDRVQNCLLNADVRFLREQLGNENIELLLINGGGVACQFEKEFKTNLKEWSLGELGPIPEFSGGPTRLYSGYLQNRIQIIAWNVNLQSSFGVSNELKYVLAERVGQIANGL